MLRIGLCWSQGKNLHKSLRKSWCSLPSLNNLGRFYGKEIAVGDLRHTIAEMKKLPKAKKTSVIEFPWLTYPRKPTNGYPKWWGGNDDSGFKYGHTWFHFSYLFVKFLGRKKFLWIFVAQWYLRWFDLLNEPRLLSKFIHEWKTTPRSSSENFTVKQLFNYFTWWFCYLILYYRYEMIWVESTLIRQCAGWFADSQRLHWWGLCSWWTFTEAQHHCHGAADTHTDPKEATNPQSGRRLDWSINGGTVELLHLSRATPLQCFSKANDLKLDDTKRCFWQVLTFLLPWKRSQKWWKKWSMNLRKASWKLRKSPPFHRPFWVDDVPNFLPVNGGICDRSLQGNHILRPEVPPEQKAPCPPEYLCQSPVFFFNNRAETLRKCPLEWPKFRSP